MIALASIIPLAIIAGVVYVAFRSTAGERDPDGWAARRRVALTPRSRPYVDAYVRRATLLRAVGVLVGIFLPAAVTTGTGIDLGVPGLVWMFAGYLTAGVLTELSLARVPASPTRVASLAVRRRDRYVARWVTWGQVAVPAAAVAGTAVALRRDPRPALGSFASITGAVTADEALGDAVACAVAAAVALAVTLAAQQWIVRRPRPGAEPDLAAADEALRTASVHLLGVTQTATALVLLGGTLGYFVHAVPERLTGWVTAAIIGTLLGALLLWGLRMAPPGVAGGAMAPPVFDPEAAAAALLVPSTGDAAPARRMTAWAVGGATAAVLVVLAMAGLRWVGPFNPAVQVSAARWEMGADGSGVVRLDVFNDSLVPVTLEAVTLPAEATNGTAVTGVVASRDGGGDWPGQPLPQEVPARRGLIVEVRLNGPGPCAPVTPPLSTPSSAAVPVEVSWSTPTGVRRSGQAAPGGTRSGPGVDGCIHALPTGTPPADPAAAEADIAQAFATVYGGPPDPEVKSQRIDDFTGLDGVSAQARGMGFGPQMESNRASVERVSFDRPDHAWVAYRLSAAGNGARRGEAVLVDGTWRITRATVCQDLALAGARCPLSPVELPHAGQAPKFIKGLDVHRGASVQSGALNRPVHRSLRCHEPYLGGNQMPYQRRHRRRLAAGIAGALLVALTGCGRGGGTTPPPPPPPGTSPGTGNPGTGRAPVIFVHGFGSSASQWTGVMGQFRSKGYAGSDLSAISYNSQVAIATSSQTLAAEVQRVLARTGAPRVDIVSHSMGSMVAKHCIIVGGCKGKTAHWNSISGVDNGTANEIIIARGTASNEDVQGRTPLRKQLQDNWNVIVQDGVKVQVHWSANDGIVVPGSLSQEPPPAVNIAKPALNHMSIYSNAQVINEVVSFFAS